VIRPRIVLAKPGLDGHDRGVKVVAMGLRDAGAEVIYLGLRVTPAQLVAAAEAEDADLIGISVLSGAHVPITKQILAAMRDAGLDVPLIVGGHNSAGRRGSTVRAWRGRGLPGRDLRYPTSSAACSRSPAPGRPDGRRR